MSDLPTPTDEASARAFLAALHSRGWLYHPDDEAADCLRWHGLDAGTLARIEAGMASCRHLLPDIYEEALLLVNA